MWNCSVSKCLPGAVYIMCKDSRRKFFLVNCWMQSVIKLHFISALFFVLRLLPLGVATVDRLSASHPIPNIHCIPLQSSHIIGVVCKRIFFFKKTVKEWEHKLFSTPKINGGTNQDCFSVTSVFLSPMLHFTPLLLLLLLLSALPWTVTSPLLIRCYFYILLLLLLPALLSCSPPPLEELSIHLFSKWNDDLFVGCGVCSAALWVKAVYAYAPYIHIYVCGQDGDLQQLARVDNRHLRYIRGCYTDAYSSCCWER